MPLWIHERDTAGLFHYNTDYQNSGTLGVTPSYYYLPYLDISTVSKKYGAGSFKCNTHDYPYNIVRYTPTAGKNTKADIDINKRFHIDFWAMDEGNWDVGDELSLHYLFIHRDTTSGTGNAIAMAQGIDSNTKKYLYIVLISTSVTGGNVYEYYQPSTASSGISEGVFTHYCLCRDSDTTVKFYIGGVLTTTITVDAGDRFSSNSPITDGYPVGRWYLDIGREGGGASALANNWYIDEFRMAPYNKYSGAFTPPTAEYDL